MEYLVNGRQMKMADQYTIQEKGTPSLTLMERAAESCVRVMDELGMDLSRPCVVCGSGNNGGDGFAIARILAERGKEVTVFLVGNHSSCTEETKHQMRLLKDRGIQISEGYEPGDYSLIVDAIFGVGLGREIIGRYVQVIQQMNEADAQKFAVDLPSGISADHGAVMGIAFQADVTVTFQTAKLGLSLYPGKRYAGKVFVEEIGIDLTKAEEDPDIVCAYERDDYRKLLPLRRGDANKGTCGKLLVIAGSKGMAGAAYLNAYAAYMAGAGLVQIYTAEENRVILQQQLPEAIVTTYELYDQGELLRLLKWADVVCVGSGLGTTEKARKILRATLENVRVPCLVDADGLNLIAAHKKYLDVLSGHDLVFTPHMMEMSRLTDLTIEEIRSSRMDVVKRFAHQHGLTCVLKDARTVIASIGRKASVNRSGNSSMAKAGSGDVLSGVIAGLMAQGMEGYQAAVLGTYLHGRAADLARERKGTYSVMARDLIEFLAGAWNELEE